MDEMIKYLKALVFLQLNQQTGGAAFSKPEFLLAGAGLAHKEIAEILNKKVGAVGMTISRARKAQAEAGNE